MATTSVLYRLVGQDSGASRVFDTVGRSASRSEQLLRGFAEGGELVGEALVKAADDSVHFESSMTKISTQAGGTARDVKVLDTAVLGIGPSTEQGPQQLADSLVHLKSVGMDNAKAMLALKTSSDLAAVGGADLEATTNALAGAWRTGIKGATDFGQAAATTNAIIGAGNMKMEDLVEAIGTGILPSAKAFGLSYGQVGAALALFTDEGVPASDAATRLRMSLSLLGAASPVADKQLAKIGLTSLQLGTAMRGPNGIIGAVALLKGHLEDSGLSAVKQSALLSRAFGGGRSSSAIISMVNNLDVLRLKQEQINSSTGKYSAAVEAQRKTAEAQLHLLESSLQTASIEVGNAILPPLTKAAEWVTTKLLPSLGKVTSKLERLVPVATIKSQLGEVRSDFTAFIDGLSGKTVAAKVTAAFVAPWTKVRKTVSSGPRTALAQELLGAQGHVGLSAVAPGPSSSLARQMLAQQTPRSLYAQSAGPGSAAAAQLMAAQVPGALYTPAKTIPAPDPGPWQKTGKTITGIITGLVVFGGQLATSFHNLVTAATPTAVFLGTTLLGALSVVAHILSTLVGPAFVSFTGFLAQHQGVVKFFAEVILGGLIIKMTVLGTLRAATGITEVGTAILKFPTAQAGQIGTAFTNLKSAGTDFKNAAAGIGTKIKGLGTTLAGSARSAKDLAGDLGALAQYGAKKTWDAIKSGASTVGGSLRTAAGNARTFGANVGTAIASGAKSAWSGLVSGASAAGTAVAGAAKASWDWVTAAAASTAAALKQAIVWTGQKVAVLASAAAEGIATAAQWLWNLAMTANPIGVVVVVIGLLVAGIIWVATKTTWFQTIWKYTWSGIQTAAVDTWHFLDKWVIQPIAAAFTWLWEKGIQPALRFILSGFLDMVGKVLQGAVSMLGWVPGVGGKLKGALKEFNSFRDGVNAALGGIKPKTVPVTISFNGTPEGKITGHTFTSTTGFTYAEGGQIPTWMGKPGQDSVHVLAMPGEFIVNTKSTAKNLPLLTAINSGDPKKYAAGGLVGAASADMALANRLDIAAQVKQVTSAYAKAYNASAAVQGLAWARTQVGQPYQWGGNGDPSWDCSGFMSAIESVMRGEAPHRRWATGAFAGPTAPQGWKLGAKSPFRIGVTNAGVGHTAGTLNGVHVEMSTAGGRVGGDARGADDPLFPAQYGLTGFDKGGIARGTGYMPKMTAQPERVLSPRQTAAFEQLVAQLSRPSGGPGQSGAEAFTKLGAAIPAGVAAGVTGNAFAAHAAVTAMAKGTVTAFSTELQIGSPSKKYRSLGAYTVDGLVQGLTGSTAAARAAAKRIANYLYVDFGATGHAALQATVARDSKALLDLAARRDAVAVRLKTANARLASLQKAWSDEQKSVADSITQSATVVTANASAGAGAVVANFAAQTQKAIQFAQLLHTAQKHGLNAAMVQQIAAAGVDGGFATAQALATAGGDPIRQLNKMQSTLQTAANSVGGAVADSMYGAGIHAAQGLVKGLQSQEKQIDAQMLRIALAMQTSIKKALGIRSPSTVAAKIGVFFPQGLGVGIKQGTHHAVGAVMSMSAAVNQAAARELAATPVPARPRAHAARTSEPAPPGTAGQQGGMFVGDLYLDSGQFLGVVRGEIKANDRDRAFRAKVGRAS